MAKRKSMTKKQKKIERTKKSKKQKLSDDIYIFSCPYCGKRISLNEKKWISKE